MENTHDITFRDILRVLFRYKLVFFCVLVVLMTATYISVELRIPQYVSSVKILVSDHMQKDVEYTRIIGQGSYIETMMLLAKSKPVLDRTIRVLKLDQRPFDYAKPYASYIGKILIDHEVDQLESTFEEMNPGGKKAFLANRAMNMLLDNISVGPMGEAASMFSISYTDYDPRNAAIIANVISRSFIIFDIEQQIAQLSLTYGEKNATIVKLRHHIKKLEDSLDGRWLPDIEAMGPASIKIAGQASLGVALPLRPSKAIALVIAFVLSVIFSVMLAFAFDHFDHTFKSPKDVEEFLNVRSLGSIPKTKSNGKLLVEQSKPDAKYVQSIHDVSAHIYSLMRDKNIKSFLITNAEGLRDNLTIIANIGIDLANRTEKKVLIIDADLRGTFAVSKFFKISNKIGLADVIQRKASLEESLVSLDTNLYLLPAGNTVLNPHSIIESLELSDLIKKAKEQFDFVFIHCADLKNVKDAIVLSSYIDGIALVISEGKVRRQIIETAIAPLKQKKANIIGAIIYNRRYFIPKIIYKLT